MKKGKSTRRDKRAPIQFANVYNCERDDGSAWATVLGPFQNSRDICEDHSLGANYRLKITWKDVPNGH